MNAVRVRRKIESDTLYLPELKPLIGKTVEIIVLEEAGPTVIPGTGDWDSALKAAEELRNSGYDFGAYRKQREADEADQDCFRDVKAAKPLATEDKKALRSLLTADQFQALMDIVERGGPDLEAIARIRAASMT